MSLSESKITPHPDYPATLGARLMSNGRCQFRVWAPKASRVELQLVDGDRLVEMQRAERGYFELSVEGIEPDTRYFYRLDGRQSRPDPVSRCQPEGVHRASAVVSSNFDWTDQNWRGIPLHEYITYELHVGTFTREGTFDAVIPRLDELKDLGITAIELLPVAQFPGTRNWGYDGVHLFAPQNSYGGPEGLKRLVNACHECGLALIMDVVYNHIGPEGNYLGEFGYYFTPRHHTPWGEAVNFDDAHSDEVRRFFIENALYWIDEYHVDALRLDAIHAIYDFSAKPFLQELATAVRTEGERLNRHVYTIAESSLHDARLLKPAEFGGSGIDAQWCDDLHHSLRTMLLDAQGRYFADYRGFDDVVKAYRDGFVLDGRYSEYRGRRHGNSARDISPTRLVVFSQNHDQVGNQTLGARLSTLVEFDQLKVIAGAVILSPFQPFLFMGEEYGEPAPFLYFVSHLDENLVQAVRAGRTAEFAEFGWKHLPPDPQDENTFLLSKLNHDLKSKGRHRVLREYYKALISLRKSNAALSHPSRDRLEVHVLAPHTTMALHAWSADHELLTVFHFGRESVTVEAPFNSGEWFKLIDSADEKWLGKGSHLRRCIQSPGSAKLQLSGHSMTVYRK